LDLKLFFAVKIEEQLGKGTFGEVCMFFIGYLSFSGLLCQRSNNWMLVCGEVDGFEQFVKCDERNRDSVESKTEQSSTCKILFAIF
jgi:hypothetical protein